MSGASLSRVFSLHSVSPGGILTATDTAKTRLTLMLVIERACESSHNVIDFQPHPMLDARR